MRWPMAGTFVVSLVVTVFTTTRADAQILAPGARSIGMGLAFTAVADDVTTIKLNPAGLVILTKPEVSANLEVLYPEFGQIFASVALPLSKAATVAAFYQRSGFEDFNEVSTFGVGGGVRLGDRLALGAAVQFSNGTLDLVPEDVSLEESSTAISFNVGALLNPNGKLSVGANYQQDDVFGVKSLRGGVAVRPTDRWVLSGEVSRLTSETFGGNFSGALDEGVAQYDVQFGAERTFVMGTTAISLRAGVQVANLNNAAFTFAEGRLINVTGGLGVVVQHVQIDAGVLNLSDDGSEIGIVSATYRF